MVKSIDKLAGMKVGHSLTSEDVKEFRTQLLSSFRVLGALNRGESYARRQHALSVLGKEAKGVALEESCANKDFVFSETEMKSLKPVIQGACK